MIKPRLFPVFAILALIQPQFLNAAQPVPGEPVSEILTNRTGAPLLVPENWLGRHFAQPQGADPVW